MGVTPRVATGNGASNASALVVAGPYAPLLAFDRWIPYRMVPRERGGSDKVPCNLQGRPASCNDPANWHDYDSAVSATADDAAHQVGFCLYDDGKDHEHPFTVLDLDKCVDPHTRMPNAFAAEILRRFPTLTEISPSGTGLHLYLRAKAPANRKSAQVEVFSRIGFVTCTGDHLAGTPAVIAPLQAELDALLAEHFPPPREAPDAADHVPGGVDPQLLRSALSALDPDCGYHEWIEIGIAVHDASAGEPYGRAEWDLWSAQGAKYAGQRDLNAHWRSFTAGGGITSATLLARARDRGWSDPRAELGARIAQRILSPPLPPAWTAPAGETMPELLHELPVPALQRLADWMGTHTDDDVRQIAMAGAIATASALAARRYFTDPWNNVPSLYLNVVASSGAGKDHIRRCAAQVLRASGNARMVGPGSFTSASALRSSLLGHPVRLCFLDEFGDQLRFAYMPHGGGHLRTLFDQLKTVYSDMNGTWHAHQQSTLAVKPQDAAQLSRNEVRWPALTLVGLCTPGQLFEALHGSHVEGGLIARFVTVYTANLPTLVRPAPREDLPPDVRAWARAMRPKNHLALVGKPKLEELARELPPWPVRICASEEATAAFWEFKLAADARAAELGERGSLPRRWRENALRLATVLAASANQAAPHIDLATARWAIEYVRFHGERFLRLMEGQSAQTPFEADCNRLLALLRERAPEGFSKRDLIRKSPLRSLDKRAREEVLSTLLERGEIAREYEPAKDGANGGGRPNEIIYASSV